MSLPFLAGLSAAKIPTDSMSFFLIAHQDNSLDEINTLEQCIRSLIHLNPGAAIGLITSLLSKETNVPTNLIWDLIEGPAKEDVEAWLGRAAGGEGEGDEKRAVKENLFRVSLSRA